MSSSDTSNINLYPLPAVMVGTDVVRILYSSTAMPFLSIEDMLGLAATINQINSEEE